LKRGINLNKSRLLKYEIISTIFVFILGTLLHFTYDWSNKNFFIGLFSAVNESTWEHLKLVFYPTLISSIVGYILFKNKYPNYLFIKTKSIFISLSFIVIFFYTYTGIIGNNYAILDIGSFFLSIILGEIYSIKKIKNNTKHHNIISYTLLAILTICFIVFTIYPPHINLFKDPITNTYGIRNNK
jgi:hypothetical protein